VLWRRIKKMDENQLTKILEKLQDHEKRLKALEDKLVTPVSSSSTVKQITLSEMVKRKEFKSGQEKIAAIVGYYEKILHKIPTEANIKEGWIKGKFDGKYRSNLLERAVGNVIRDLENGKFDLSQSGETFFEGLLSSK
jgi:hypothetical protein